MNRTIPKDNTSPTSALYRLVRRLRNSRFRIKVSAALRHPLNSRKRKNYRAKRPSQPQGMTPSTKVIAGVPDWAPGARTVLLCSHQAGKRLFGGERSFLDVLHALYFNGFNVVATLPSADNAQYLEIVRSMAQEVRVFPYSWGKGDPLLSLRAEPLFRAIIREVRPDVVYVNTIVLTAPLMAARLCGIPSIVHAREIPTHDRALQQALGVEGPDMVKQVLRSCVELIANSRATARCFAITGRSHPVIPNIVDLDQFDFPNRIEGDVVRFGLISSNGAKKGIEDVVELAKLCKHAVPSARFRIIGPLSSLLIRDYLTGKRSAPENVEFMDYVNLPQEALASVNVVLNFSHFQESFGRTVLEGMAAGRPCIAYEWGALPELIEHGVTGFLVPYRQPRAAIEYVKALCEMNTLHRMGAAARERARLISNRETFNRKIGEVVHRVICRNFRDSRPYSEVREARLHSLREKPIDIIICVHNALDHVKACLVSVEQHLGRKHRVILVDDGSDRETEEFLKDYVRLNVFATLHRNPVPLGYTRAANIGASLSTADFFVFLNSDAIVTPFWAEKLADAVYSVPGAGIVGPLSNAASYQSLPSVQGTSTQTPVNSLPEGLTADDMNEWCEKHSTAVVPCVPLVHGFCFGVTREAWSTLGPFDEEAFPNGYGEEDDYCFRASNAGFAIVIATHTYVFHAKSKSYSENKRVELTKRSREVIFSRHGQERFSHAVQLLEEHPILQRLRREAMKLYQRHRAELIAFTKPQMSPQASS